MADPVAVEMHPVQRSARRGPTRITSAVTLRAYEVYCHVYGEQEAMVTGWCRGGFGDGELIAFLYARSFPKSEWRARVDEVFKNSENL
jgi:hypothetical protein